LAIVFNTGAGHKDLTPLQMQQLISAARRRGQEEERGS